MLRAGAAGVVISARKADACDGDDIVGTTLLLAAGAYVTGVVMPLDGGITGCG